MRIVAFGSSHTTGYNLDDIKKSKSDAVSKYAFPQIVADMFKCECLNLGKNGNGIDQIYTDVFGYLGQHQEDDFIIIQLPANPTWFKLVTSDDDSISIVNPDSLDYKGRNYQRALHQYYGILTGDSHWNRLWYINFYSLINLLHSRNIKFTWFFDSFSDPWGKLDYMISKLPRDVQTEIQDIKYACPDPMLTHIDKLFADYISLNIPNSLKECGHYDQTGHRFWAETVLVPYIKQRLQHD